MRMSSTAIAAHDWLRWAERRNLPTPNYYTVSQHRDSVSILFLLTDGLSVGRWARRLGVDFHSQETATQWHFWCAVSRNGVSVRITCVTDKVAAEVV